MRKSTEAVAWVVYLMAVHGKPAVQASAVCEQKEWEEMERERPGHHTLVRAGIASEPEAEALAREQSGYAPPAPRSGVSRPKPAKRAAACTPLLGMATPARK